MESKTKELVKAGHELVVLLGTQHGMHDAASLVQRLTAQLDVTAVVLREKSKQCDALAAENAALKVHLKGTVDFCYSELPETPATDRFLREQMAKGVEAFAKKCSEKSKQAISSDTRDSWWLCGEHADDFAAQLRAGEAV